MKHAKPTGVLVFSYLVGSPLFLPVGFIMRQKHENWID